MKQLDIDTFHDFSDEEISRRILMEDPVMRVVLVSLRAGQALPEHAANWLVTVYSVGGRVLFYEWTECCDMVPGALIRLAPGRPHHLEAKEDSRLLVGAEVAARIEENCIGSLDGPVVRVAAKDTFVPSAPDLELAVLPSVAGLRLGAEKALAF